MPAHDCTRVAAGIFPHFHHAWLEKISRTLNQGILPNDYYAMAEQQAAGNVSWNQRGKRDDGLPVAQPPNVSLPITCHYE